MCIENKLSDYQTKDVEVKVLLEKLKGCFSSIGAIRDQAQQIAQANAGATGIAGGVSDQGYINDITSLASNFVQRGATLLNQAGPRVGLQQHQMHILKEKDENAIREKLKEIDDILTRECLFCGSLLIDMVDNDVTIETHVVELEDDEPQPSPQKVEVDEWTIE